MQAKKRHSHRHTLRPCKVLWKKGRNEVVITMHTAGGKAGGFSPSVVAKGNSRAMQGGRPDTVMNADKFPCGVPPEGGMTGVFPPWSGQPSDFDDTGCRVALLS